MTTMLDRCMTALRLEVAQEVADHIESIVRAEVAASYARGVEASARAVEDWSGGGWALGSLVVNIRSLVSQAPCVHDFHRAEHGIMPCTKCGADAHAAAWQEGHDDGVKAAEERLKEMTEARDLYKKHADDCLAELCRLREAGRKLELCFPESDHDAWPEVIELRAALTPPADAPRDAFNAAPTKESTDANRCEDGSGQSAPEALRDDRGVRLSVRSEHARGPAVPEGDAERQHHDAGRQSGRPGGVQAGAVVLRPVRRGAEAVGAGEAAGLPCTCVGSPPPAPFRHQPWCACVAPPADAHAGTTKEGT